MTGDGGGDKFADLVLKCEDVRDRPVIALGPDRFTAFDTGQEQGDANALACPTLPVTTKSAMSRSRIAVKSAAAPRKAEAECWPITANWQAQQAVGDVAGDAVAGNIAAPDRRSGFRRAARLSPACGRWMAAKFFPAHGCLPRALAPAYRQPRPVNRRDHAGVQHLPQRRDMNLQGVLLDHHTGPDRGEDRVLADNFTCTLQQHAHQFEGARRAGSAAHHPGSSTSRSSRFSLVWSEPHVHPVTLPEQHQANPGGTARPIQDRSGLLPGLPQGL